MRYIIVLKCQRRDQQWLGLVLHTSETVHCRECKRRTREKEGAILECYGRACCPWTAWEKAVVSPDFLGFARCAEFRSCEMGLRRSLSWTRSEFPEAPYQRLAEKKEDRFVAQMSLLSCDFSCMTVFLFHVDFEFVLKYCACRAWYTVYEIPPHPMASNPPWSGPLFSGGRYLFWDFFSFFLGFFFFFWSPGPLVL